MARREEVGIDVIAKDLATREIQGVGRSLEGLARETESTSKSFGFLQNAIMGVFQGLGQQVFQKLQQGLAMMGEMAIGFNAKMEQARIGFTTMLGSAEKAQKFISELLDFSKATPFQFEGLQKSANLIMAMGFAAEEVIPLLTAAGDAVAALGAGEDAVYRVVYALGQMRAAGRVTGQDMMQLASIGIPAWKMLADSMGVTVQQAKLLAEQGKIDAETAIAAITTAIEEGNMGGMMAAQANTFNGALSTVKDTVTILVSSAFKPFFDVLSAGTLQMATFLSTERVERFGKKIAEAMKVAAEAIAAVVSAFIPLVQIWLDHINVYIPVIIGLIGVKLVAAFKAAAASGRLLAFAMGGVKTAIVLAIPFIGEIGDAFGVWLGRMQGLSQSGAMLAIQLGKIAGPFGDSLNKTVALADQLGMDWEELGQIILETNMRTGESFEEIVYHLENSGAGMANYGRLTKEELASMQAAYSQTTDEVEFSVKTFAATLPEYMRASVEEMAAAAKPWGEGVSLALEDGSTIFASSAEELANLLPEKIKEARLAAIMEARRAPMDLGGAVLDTISDWEDAIEAIGTAWEDGLTEQAMQAHALGFLIGSELAAGLNSDKPAYRDALIVTMHDSLATLQSMNPEWFTAGGMIPDNLMQGMEPGLRAAAALGDQTAIDLLAKWNSHQEQVRIDGARAGKGLVEGVETELTNRKGQLDIKFQTTLSVPKSYDWGKAIGSAWVNGIIGGIDAKMYQLELMMGHIKKITEGGSPPPEGPLKNIDVGGYNIGVAWVEGIAKGIGRSTGLVSGMMGGIFTGGLGRGGHPVDRYNPGGADFGAGFGGGGFGVTITIINNFGAGSVRSEEDVREISRQTAERVRLLGVPLAQSQVGVIA